MTVVLKGNDKRTGRTVEVEHESAFVRGFLRAPSATTIVVPSFRGVIQNYVIESLENWDVQNDEDHNWWILFQQKADYEARNGNYITSMNAVELQDPSVSVDLNLLFSTDDLVLSLVNTTDWSPYEGETQKTGLVKATLSLLRVPE